MRPKGATEPNPDHHLDSLRLKILDLNVVHMHGIDDLVYVTYTMVNDDKSETISIGSVLLSACKVAEMKLQPGDILTILVQKSKSVHHDKLKK